MEIARIYPVVLGRILIDYLFFVEFYASNLMAAFSYYFESRITDLLIDVSDF